VTQLPQDDKKDKKDLAEGLGLSPEILNLLAKFQEIELEDFQLEAKELELSFEPGMTGGMMPKLKLPPGLKAKPVSMLQAAFMPPVETYPGTIAEVKLGGTKAEGGTRGRTLTIGGETSPAFYTFERPIVHSPIITLDVFDMEVPLSKAVKMHVKDVVGDPAAWAKLAVEKFGADMVYGSPNQHRPTSQRRQTKRRSKNCRKHTTSSRRSSRNRWMW